MKRREFRNDGNNNEDRSPSSRPEDNDKAVKILINSLLFGLSGAIGIQLHEQDFHQYISASIAILTLASYCGLSAQIIEAIDVVAEKVPRSLLFQLELVPEIIPKASALAFEVIAIATGVQFSIHSLLQYLNPDKVISVSAIRPDIKLGPQHTLTSFAVILFCIFMASLLRQYVSDDADQ